MRSTHTHTHTRTHTRTNTYVRTRIPSRIPEHYSTYVSPYNAIVCVCACVCVSVRVCVCIRAIYKRLNNNTSARTICVLRRDSAGYPGTPRAQNIHHVTN